MLNQNKILVAGKFKLSERDEKIIREKVSTLPQKERLAIYFLFWEEHSLLRISHELCTSTDDVARRLSNGMARLRSELTDVADRYFGTIAPANLEQVA